MTVKSPDKLEIMPTKEKYFDAGHTHDDTVTSVALELPGDLDSKKINDWFSVLLQTQGPNIFRKSASCPLRLRTDGFSCSHVV